MSKAGGVRGRSRRSGRRHQYRRRLRKEELRMIKERSSVQGSNVVGAVPLNSVARSRRRRGLPTLEGHSPSAPLDFKRPCAKSSTRHKRRCVKRKGPSACPHHACKGPPQRSTRGVASPKEGEGVPPLREHFRSYDFTATLPARLAPAATSC
jgi:hypothetical protein